MKKAISVILMLIAAIISTACSGSKMSAPEGSTSAVTKDPDELFAEKMKKDYYDYWITYENPKLNEEVRSYGYDENGNLVLPLSELRHAEEVLPKRFTISPAIKYPISERFNKSSPEYRNMDYYAVVTGYVVDLTSYCTRTVRIVNEANSPDHPGLPEQWSVSYDGYTETKIMITGIISIGNHVQGEEYDYSYLVGKVITTRQDGFWYYDDEGELCKGGTARRYTYVLKPNVEAVITVGAFDTKNALSDCTTGAEAYENLHDQKRPRFVYDFYPNVNKQGEKITTPAMLEAYYKSLDEEYGGLYDPWGKKNAVKENLAL